MKPLRIYIAGPMTGLPDLNRPAFAAAAEEIKALGHEPVNPHDLHPGDVTWEQAMRVDVAALVACDALYALRGWGDSAGARIEVRIAVALAIPYQVESELGLLIQRCRCPHEQAHALELSRIARSER